MKFEQGGLQAFGGLMLILVIILTAGWIVVQWSHAQVDEATRNPTGITANQH